MSNSPKPPLKGKLRDWRAAVKWLAEIATHPKTDPVAILERRARHEAICSFPELFSRAPKFINHLDFGSPNIRGLWCALGLLHPATRDAATRAWLNSRDLSYVRGFMLEEPGSRIYGAWHLAAHLVGYRAAHSHQLTELQPYFSQWLQLWWTLQALSLVETPANPRSLYCGARSQGMFDAVHTDYALALALDLSWRRQRGINAYWRKLPEIQIFNAYRNVIEASAVHVRDQDHRALIAACPQWPSIIETHYLRTSTGLAVWIDDTSQPPAHDDIPNTNTPGVSAMGFDSRFGLWSLPDSSRDHVRQRAVHEHVTTHYNQATGRPVSLTYTQSGTGRQITDEQDLPSGEVVYYIRHGRDGIREIVTV